KIELNPGAAYGRLAAFVDGELFRFRLGGTDKFSNHQVDEKEDHSHAKKDDEVIDQRGHEGPGSQIPQGFAALILELGNHEIHGKGSRRETPASSSCQCPTSGSPSRQHRYTSRPSFQQGKSTKPVKWSLSSTFNSRSSFSKSRMRSWPRSNSARMCW